VKRSQTREHPAVTSAKRAIRRGLAPLTPRQTFHVAALVDMLHTGTDASGWVL
jgi:hypothetical protein